MAVAKVTEIIASSPKSFDDAVVVGIKRASKTLKNIQGAWIAEQKIKDINAFDLDHGARIIAGTARSMGITVEG